MSIYQNILKHLSIDFNLQNSLYLSTCINVEVNFQIGMPFKTPKLLPFKLQLVEERDGSILQETLLGHMPFCSN